MKPEEVAGTYGWEQLEGHPLRKAIDQRLIDQRMTARQGGIVPEWAPHYFVSPASARVGCDTCGQPRDGHPEP